MMTFVEYIKESLIKHISIELRDYDIVYEKYGVYDGCDELLDYIYNKIYNKIKHTKKSEDNIIIKYSDIQYINNLSFNELSVSYSQDNSYDGEYFYEETGDIDEQTGKLSYAHISLNYININNEQKIKESLTHELTHVFDDWKLHLIGIKTFSDIFNNKNYNWARAPQEHNVRLTSDRIRSAVYMLYDYESRAFIAQICQEVKNIRDELYHGQELNTISANEVYRALKTTDIYRMYMDIVKLIDLYNRNRLFKKEIIDIENEWNSVFTDKTYNIDMIFSCIIKKFQKLQHKIESLIPKKIAEELYPIHKKNSIK